MNIGTPRIVPGVTGSGRGARARQRVHRKESRFGKSRLRVHNKRKTRFRGAVIGFSIAILVGRFLA